MLEILKNPTQERVSQTSNMGQEQIALIQVEIEIMLNKGANSKQRIRLGIF